MKTMGGYKYILNKPAMKGIILYLDRVMNSKLEDASGIGQFGRKLNIPYGSIPRSTVETIYSVNFDTSQIRRANYTYTMMIAQNMQSIVLGNNPFWDYGGGKSKGGLTFNTMITKMNEYFNYAYGKANWEDNQHSIVYNAANRKLLKQICMEVTFLMMPVTAAMGHAVKATVKGSGGEMINTILMDASMYSTQELQGNAGYMATLGMVTDASATETRLQLADSLCAFAGVSGYTSLTINDPNYGGLPIQPTSSGVGAALAGMDDLDIMNWGLEHPDLSGFVRSGDHTAFAKKCFDNMLGVSIASMIASAAPAKEYTAALDDSLAVNFPFLRPSAAFDLSLSGGWGATKPAYWA